jgi:site-specific DNA-methyltransferase (adenine-specific)/site-specific DNA-methyltransferase (cytosine-N4-specific)
MYMRSEDTQQNGTHTLSGEKVHIVVGNARDELTKYESGTFQCCVTSPPYWSLRDYGIPGQIGAEPSLDGYIADIVDVFREVYRTLSDDGTLWLNIGDSYTSGDRTWRAPDKKNRARAMTYRPPTPPGLKPKDLIGIPWKIAFALQETGWYLRSDIIWHKPNCQPESVKDRPTRAHEYLFLFSKSERYYYDYEAVKEPASDTTGLRNRRTIWSINTQGFNGNHFAVFPPDLVKICLLAGSGPGSLVLDPFLGSGTVAEVCLEMDRRCIGIELNPDYAQIAQKRLSVAQQSLPI